jgi:hypothetical protein
MIQNELNHRRQTDGEISPQVTFDGPPKSGKVANKKLVAQNHHSGCITLLAEKKARLFEYLNKDILVEDKSIIAIFICSQLSNGSKMHLS